jgi:UDP-glucose 4-epimerase
MAERKTRQVGDRSARPVDPEHRVIAVTGARGFIGSELVKRLEEDRRYARILALDIRKPDFPLDKTRFYKLDLTLPTADADLADLLGREEVDTVVHAAFLSRPTHAQGWAHELEDIGTMHVLNACAEARVPRFVLSSSTLVYGPSPANPNFLVEDHGLSDSPECGFLHDKVGAERQVRRFRAENPERVVTVLRAAPTLGPTIDNFVTRFFARPIAPILMGYDPLLQLVHEQDLIDAVKLAVDEEHRGEYNIVADGVLPYSTVLAMMGKFPLHLPSFLATPLARTLWAMQIGDAPPGMLGFLRFLCVADGARARRELGFAPRYDIRGTIKDFLGVASEAASRA